MITKKMVKQAMLEPTKYDSKKDFLFRSYEKWALEEAFHYIDDHPEMPTIDALTNFTQNMTRYSCMAKSRKTSYMFAVAADFGNFLQEVFWESEAFH